MAIGIFGGSFDPVHSQHVRYAEEAIKSLGLTKLYVLPSFVAPHKKSGAHASASDRLELCKLAFSHLPEVEVSDYEIKAGGTSYSYLTCRHFKEEYPDEKIYFFVGADMLEDFFTWRNPDELLEYCTLAACGRGKEGTEVLKARFFQRFQKEFVTVPFRGEEVSSTQIRVNLAFRRPSGLPSAVEEYIRRKNLYEYPCIFEALALEKPSRQAHTYRVAMMATMRARSVGVGEEAALLAAALHDCTKYLPLDDARLRDCTIAHDVPSPVVHQFTGAYLAERTLGISDGEILNAIRYHTSGRENMSTLEKLIFLADTLEEERDFPHVEELRALFWQDLDECLYQTLAHQTEYLRKTGKEIYPLTERAYRWIKHQRERNI